MRLAARCGYPVGYFHNLDMDSDEDLEIERNDVRDLLRGLVGAPALAHSSSGTQSGNQSPTHDIRNLLSLKLLVRLLVECEQGLLATHDSRVVFEEVVAHAFSSLGTCDSGCIEDRLRNASNSCTTLKMQLNRWVNGHSCKSRPCHPHTFSGRLIRR
jgi:hypothetical protein